LLSSAFGYSPLFVAQGLSLLGKQIHFERDVWVRKTDCAIEISEASTPEGVDDGFVDASSRCKIKFHRFLCFCAVLTSADE
jgi:hypothetical protein